MPLIEYSSCQGGAKPVASPTKREGGLRYNNIAIFYIPRDRTLTYLMRNSKQHRVSSPAGCGLARAETEESTWQSRHVLRAPNDVFICNHILLRTHYRAGPRSLGIILTVCVLVPGCGRWISSQLSILTPTLEMRKVLRLARHHQQRLAPSSNTNICSQGRRRETKLPRNLRCLVWHSRNGHPRKV